MLSNGLLAMAGALALGPSLTPFPAPAERAREVYGGAYGLMRHPIDTGVLLVSLGFLLATASPAPLAITAVLALFFDRNAQREEGRLHERYPGYEAYRAREALHSRHLHFLRVTHFFTRGHSMKSITVEEKAAPRGTCSAPPPGRPRAGLGADSRDLRLARPMNEVAQRLGKLPKDREIVVICAKGGRSAKITALLYANSFPKAVNLRGRDQILVAPHRSGSRGRQPVPGLPFEGAASVPQT